MDWNIYQLAEALTREAARIRRNDQHHLTARESEIYSRLVETIRQLCLEATPRQIGPLSPPIHHLAETDLDQLGEAVTRVEAARSRWWRDQAELAPAAAPAPTAQATRPPCDIISLADRQRKSD